MKPVIVVVVCMLVATAQVPARGDKPAGSLDIKVARASREVLVRAAALGDMRFFENDLLVIRLYGFGLPGSCIPESHQVCAHRYVLLTSSYDQAPVIKAYDLGTVGEISKVNLSGQGSGQSRMLELVVQNYPSTALKSNRRLVKRTSKVRLLITESSLEIVK